MDPAPKGKISLIPSRTRITHLAHDYPYLAHDYSHLAHDFKVGFCIRIAEVLGKTLRRGLHLLCNRVQKAEKAHAARPFSQGRGAKNKGPDCIQIRVLIWCRWWDSFAAMDIGLSCLRSALRIPPCRKPASLQNAAPRRFAGAQSSPDLSEQKYDHPLRVVIFLVPVVGLEPTRCRHQRILSPSRLPIPSHRRGAYYL